MFWLIHGSVGFPLDTSRASRLWRGRPSTTPCTRARPPPATATTTAATPRFPCSAAPARRPPQTSAVTRWDTSMSTVNWQRRCVWMCVYVGGGRENVHVVCCQIPNFTESLHLILYIFLIIKICFCQCLYQRAETWWYGKSILVLNDDVIITKKYGNNPILFLT